MVTLKDVAKEAGVGITTVSRFLNKDTTLNIPSATQERIVKAVEKLNYKPNAVARSLKLGRSKTIALIIPDFTNFVYSEIISGVEETVQKYGYHLIVLSDTNQTSKAYIDLVTEGRADGLLIASNILTDQDIVNFNQSNIPYVLINRMNQYAKGFVAADDENAAKEAVEMLIKGGHKKIAFITANQEMDTSNRRYIGYEKALLQNNLTVNKEIIEQAMFTEESGYKAMERLLSKNSTVTAVFASNVRVAFGAIAAIKKNGKRIPEDIAVMGFHHTPMCEVFDPTLSTVKVDLKEMGVKSTELLMNMMKNKDASNQHIILESFELLKRKSTGGR
ncbi:LacI family DNA-binding transcriptional regulator [Metasolibacillus sp. FSL H7-0170]|uniref:LacI family DNA-binding transcriptional regulator n=1 Tax=Metasolibacillus sp. FSL H7-0170 TaxID=2921431 RepID=UPI003158A96C